MSATAVAAEHRAWPDWHVSPWVDAVCYHYSWLWILIPLVLLGGDTARGWFTVWAIGMTASFVHRHFTMPYVYLDRIVFAQHPARFVVVPIWLGVGFLATPLVWAWKTPAGWFSAIDGVVLAAMTLVAIHGWWEDRRGHVWGGFALVPTAILPLVPLVAAGLHAFGPSHAAFSLGLVALAAVAVADQSFDARRTLPGASFARVWSAFVLAVALVGVAVALSATGGGAGVSPTANTGFRPVIGAVAAFAGAWNVWHVYMQKYGIFRMYSAKSAVPVQRRTPAWVDRLFVFGWVPLYLVVLTPAAKPLVAEHFASTKPILFPFADALIASTPVLLPVAIVVLAASLGAFVWHEWRSNGLQNVPRLSMAVGTTGLAASFLVVRADLAYMAYGFSHAIEYMVFVWAFQRRRYAEPLPHDPLIGRLLRHPWLAYGALVLIVGGVSVVLDFSDDLGWTAKPLRSFGTGAGQWLYFWTIWHSMAHFYFDGFLWKMRLPQVRASL